MEQITKCPRCGHTLYKRICINCGWVMPKKINQVFYTVDKDALVIGKKGWLFLNGSLGNVAPDAKKVIIEQRIHPNYISFEGMEFLEEIEGIRNLDTKNLTSMAGMFRLCRSLQDLDLRKFNTSNVTDMSRMFQGCNMKEIDINGFDVHKVKDFRYMFADTMLEVIRFNGFVNASPENTGFMFENSDFLREVWMSFDETHLPEYVEWVEDENHYIRKYMRDHEDIFYDGIITRRGLKEDYEEYDDMVWVSPFTRNGHAVSGFWRHKPL